MRKTDFLFKSRIFIHLRLAPSRATEAAGCRRRGGEYEHPYTIARPRSRLRIYMRAPPFGRLLEKHSALVLN